MVDSGPALPAELNACALFEHFPDAIVAVDAALRIGYANARARQLSGTDPCGLEVGELARLADRPALTEPLAHQLRRLLRDPGQPNPPSLTMQVARRWWRVSACPCPASHALLLLHEVTAQVAAQGCAERLRGQLQRWVRLAEQAKEDERKRIARDIHDDLGQALLALRIDVQLARAGADAAMEARLAALDSQIGALIQHLRTIINSLRPPVLDLGLGAALEWLVREFARRSGVAARCALHEAGPDLADHVQTALFRIAQEALANVQRHANASCVQLELERDADQVMLRITDNGIGMPRSRRRGAGVGLLGIRERASTLGGTMSATRAVPQGTCLSVVVPMHNRLAASQFDLGQ
jgi:signal transduction histidine kinase